MKRKLVIWKRNFLKFGKFWAIFFETKHLSYLEILFAKLELGEKMQKPRIPSPQS
jgi:hypothetical protein